MKKIATITSALLAMGASANAQVAFDGMEVKVSALAPTNSVIADFISYSLDTNATFTVGNFGAQADFGASWFSGSVLFVDLGEYDVGLHLFGSIGDNVKLGAFYSYDILDTGFFPLELPTYGAEVMVNFGNFDADISYANVGGLIGTNKSVLTIDGYLQLNDSLEMNAGYWGLLSSSIGSQIGLAHVGANYQFSNIPISIGASYKFGVSKGFTGSGIIEANVTYSFGQQSGARRFGKRNFSYFDLIIIAPD